MRTELFDYDLPESRIAQHPTAHREDSRALEVNREGTAHRAMKDFAEFIPEGAVVVVNDTRVRNARLLGRKRGSGGRVEIFLLERQDEIRAGRTIWKALSRANKPLRPGALVEIAGSRPSGSRPSGSRPSGAAGEPSETGAGAESDFVVEVLERSADGEVLVAIDAHGDVDREIETHGHVPLPPYVRRPDEPEDVTRYQTVYAQHLGSVAAPTAGLHLTEETLRRIEARGAEVARVTLHVGLGTFRPVTADDLDEHPMHAEMIRVEQPLIDAVERARARGGPVVAVGTTVVRALESAADPAAPGHVLAYSGETRLLIQPGYDFRTVDALLTNFHMPRSTLLALVSAFAGRERLFAAYQRALDDGYRFLSYGDAMWIPERLT